ncbi:MAG: hypothetical protein JO152_09270 [Mycobacteriaceae bacterium]|nr:hypothetical protein [Mycobacteriaceae bacterium]
MVRSTLSSITAIVLIAAATVLSGSAGAAPPQSITASATIDGHDVGAAATGAPLALYPDRSVEAAVDLTNHGQNSVEISEVQLVGRVLGLTFFSYATTIDVTLAPGASTTVRYVLDLADLKRQATGLLGGELIIRDRNHTAVAVVPTVTDVRGSLLSVYGVFGLALLVLTMLALGDAAFAFARHKASANRWRRGLRLMTPGIGIGLVLAFTTSVARWWVPRTSLWLLIAAVTAAVFFALGYFSPTPEPSPTDDETEVLDSDEIDDAAAEDAGSKAGGDHDAEEESSARRDSVAELDQEAGPRPGRA